MTSSQTTTEPEDSSFAEGEGEGLAEAGGTEGDRPKALDPTLLKVLSFATNLTLQEEEDTLGKVSWGCGWEELGGGAQSRGQGRSVG